MTEIIYNAGQVPLPLLKTSAEHSRYLAHDGKIIPFNVDEELPAHLSFLVTKYPPNRETFESVEPESEENMNNLGLFSGPISIAYVLFVLSKAEDRVVEGKRLSEWTKQYLEMARGWMEGEAYGENPVTSEDCAVGNNRTCFAAIASVVYQDQKLVEEILSYVPGVLADTSLAKAPSNEYILGRAGFLYLLRLISTWFPAMTEKVAAAKQQIIEKIISQGPKQWLFVRMPYLSVGHGWLGIIVEILMTDPTSERAAELRPLVERIIKQQGSDGNWPKYMDEVPAEKNPSLWIQWGHGAPGVVNGLSSLRPIYDKVGDSEMVSRIDQAIANSQGIIWKEGLLTKESCLCHGASGNSLALTDMAQKGTFLAYSTEAVTSRGLADGSLEASSSPGGLQRGLAGTIWAMHEYKLAKPLGTYISFNDL